LHGTTVSEPIKTRKLTEVPCSECGKVNPKAVIMSDGQSTYVRCPDCGKKAEERLHGDPITDDKLRGKKAPNTHCDYCTERHPDTVLLATPGGYEAICPECRKKHREDKVYTIEEAAKPESLIKCVVGSPDRITKDGNLIELKCGRCGWRIQDNDWYAREMGSGTNYCGPCGTAVCKELAEASGEPGIAKVPTGEKYLYNVVKNGISLVLWDKKEKNRLPPFYGMLDSKIRERLRVTDGPRVTLVAETEYIDDNIDAFLKERGINYTTDADESSDALAEFAGRMCYWSFQEHLRRKAGDGQNRTYLDHIREVGHGSVTEHSYFTFVIDDLSKNTTQELVRHRVGVAYSIQSSRYVDQFSNEYFGDSGHSFGIYIPPSVQGCRDLLQTWLDQWIGAIRCYKRTFDNLRARGVAKKDARSDARHILPGGMCNAVVFTVNCRELNHIFNLRGNFAAEREIRMMALALYEQVKHINVFSHWERRTEPVKGDYLYNTDLDKPKFKTVEEGVEYLRKTFPGNLIVNTPINHVDDHEIPEPMAAVGEYTLTDAFREAAEKEAQHECISVGGLYARMMEEDTNQDMISKEEYAAQNNRTTDPLQVTELDK
jgi:thymidylate synthase (FAD)